MKTHKPPTRRRKVKVAYTACRRSHVTCDENRPCGRCKKRGKDCDDNEPQKKSGKKKKIAPVTCDKDRHDFYEDSAESLPTTNDVQLNSVNDNSATGSQLPEYPFQLETEFLPMPSYFQLEDMIWGTTPMADTCFGPISAQETESDMLTTSAPSSSTPMAGLHSGSMLAQDADCSQSWSRVLMSTPSRIPIGSLSSAPANAYLRWYAKTSRYMNFSKHKPQGA